MKAAMLVAGGLSGGLSATIAGGNFWQGMKQGLLTSGLNHLGHVVADSFDRSNYDKLYKQVKKVMGNASDKFSGNPSDLLKLMQDVPILRELYNKYLHPEVIDTNNPELWKHLANVSFLNK